MEEIIKQSDEEEQETLCEEIVAHLQGAYECSVKLNKLSVESDKERDWVSLGIHRLKINIMSKLGIKEIEL